MPHTTKIAGMLIVTDERLAAPFCKVGLIVELVPEPVVDELRLAVPVAVVRTDGGDSVFLPDAAIPAVPVVIGVALIVAPLTTSAEPEDANENVVPLCVMAAPPGTKVCEPTTTCEALFCESVVLPTANPLTCTFFA